MITLQTITTIELASVCNLECRYCINRLLVKDPSRNAGIMDSRTFDRTMEVLGELVQRGTQKEVNMNGNGESTLDPWLIPRMRRVREVMGDGTVQFCTNGITMTDWMAKQLKDAGVDRVDISPHSPFHARRAGWMLAGVGYRPVINFSIISMSHNWAGQLEPENSVPVHFRTKCDPIIEGRGYVLSEGNVTPCCYDYRNLGVYGSVFDEDILEKPILPYGLCATCHQEIPDDARARAWKGVEDAGDHHDQQHRNVVSL